MKAHGDMLAALGRSDLPIRLARYLGEGFDCMGRRETFKEKESFLGAGELAKNTKP